MTRRHKQRRRCNRSAASARRKSCRSSFRRCAEVARRDNLLRERFEPRITAQWIEERVDSNKPYVGPGAILIRSFDPAKRLFFVAESQINKSEGKGLHVALFGLLFQLLEDFQCLSLLARRAVSVSQQSQHEGIIV